MADRSTLRTSSILRRGAAAAGLAVALFGVLPAAADPAVAEAVANHKEEILGLRHRIHQNPELGNRETETAKLVVEHLTRLGFDEIRTGVGHTGVIGILKGGKPGKVVAVRADMDALPVTEATDLPFQSTVTTEYLGQQVGVSHACGHDVHTAVELGVASVLADLRKEIPGTVVFIFQPAEEGGAGGKAMVDDGLMERFSIQRVFGMHNLPGLPVGQFAI
ncbi:MAG: amidohydrolase, partial [Acidobacteria bacterium]|nr:amidohydrolase [Acidobacteriota bacterium]